MSEIPENLLYANTHEWVQFKTHNHIRVGISDFAQQQMGDLMYIELPKIGRQLIAGDQCAVVESVKTASDLFAPVTGVIIEINPAVIEAPELVNDAPYQHWLFCIEVENPQQLQTLLTADAYRNFISESSQ
jgi:glycine cleavage system H protein